MDTSLKRDPSLRQLQDKDSFEGISIILPAYNEAENLYQVAEKILHYCDTLGSEKYELIIVNDGSKDQTEAEANRLCQLSEQHVVVLKNPTNRGYGYSIRRGIIRSRYELIFFTDADGQFDIQDLSLLIPLMQSHVPDIVIGYRMDRKDAWLRLFLSGGYNALVRLLFGISVKDVDCAFKLFRKRVFQKIKIRSRNFFINTEILAKAVHFGYRILEIGVDHLPRTAGKSTVNIWHIPLTLRELARIWFHMRKLESSQQALSE